MKKEEKNTKNWNELSENAKTAKERRQIMREKNNAMMGGRAIGSLSISDFAEMAQGGDGKHDPFIMRNYGVRVPNNAMPQMALRPQNIQFSDDGTMKINRAFTAQQKKSFGTKKQGSIIWPKYWLNPYQYQDYIILQDIYANTMAGRILDVIVFFTLAKGVTPKLEPKDTTKFKNDEEMHKKIQDAEWVIDLFKQIDENISRGGKPMPFAEWEPVDSNRYIPSQSEADSDDSLYDSNLTSKWASAMTMALTYGRVAVIPNIDKNNHKIKVNIQDNEKEFVKIPKIFQVIHPRDLGYNHVDPLTWKLRGIQLHNSNWIIRPSQQIFFEWNANNPVYGSLFYGYSLMQSMIGSARSLRRIIEVDFPLIAKTRWSGMYWVFFKRKGEGLVTSEQEHQAILSRIRLDGINVSLEDDPTADVRVEKIDLDPKINELIELCRFNIQYMMSTVSMPQGLLFGEQDLNRDTLRTGINAFLNGPIKKYKDWFLNILTEQYYARMAVTIAGQDDEVKAILEDFNLVADVDEFDLESMGDLVEIQAKLEQFGAWTAEERGKQLKIENYESKLDPDAEPPEGGPMGAMGGQMNVTTPQGQRYEVRDA